MELPDLHFKYLTMTIYWFNVLRIAIIQGPFQNATALIAIISTNGFFKCFMILMTIPVAIDLNPKAICHRAVLNMIRNRILCWSKNKWLPCWLAVICLYSGFTGQTFVHVASTRLDPSKVGWEGTDRFFLVYEWKHAQFTYTEPVKPSLNRMAWFENLLIETRTPKHCVLLVWQTNQVRLHHVKRKSLSTQTVALATYLWITRKVVILSIRWLLYRGFIGQTFDCSIHARITTNYNMTY